MNKRNLLPFFFLALSLSAHAQVDPGALIYGNDGSGLSSPEDTSGRYIRRPKKQSKTKHHQMRRLPASDPTASAVVVPSPEDARLTPSAPGATRLTSEPKNPPPTSTTTNTPTVEENPNFSASMRDFFLGGDVELIENYKSFLDAQDIRKNAFELAVSTGYFYNSSTSSYFFRNYNDTAPTLDVAADIWLTPFIGIDAEYRFTLLNTLSDSPTNNTSISANQSWMDLGIKFRRFFGMALSSASMAVGLKYINYNLDVPNSSLSRAKEQTQGPQVSLDLSLPSSRNYFWNFGLILEPFLSHSETANIGIQSGQSNQTLGVGANVGGEYRLSRQTRAFFKFTTLLYRSQFSGAAAGVDPVTGMTPNGVTATNSFYMLDLGLRFGR